VTILIRDSISPLVITTDPSLARKWLSEIEATDINDSRLNEASLLVSAIADDQLDQFCAADGTDNLFALEANYACRNYEKIVSAYRMTPKTATAQAHSAFFVADALHKMKQYKKAKALFEVIEAESDFRINYPVASIVAIERLGEIAQMQEHPDKDEALRMYRRYITVWESLDIPIESYLRATDYVASSEI
jgi:tetratricopeptide (TPR) repeat protein